MCVAVVGGGGGVGIFNDIWLRFRSSAEQTALFFFFLISISVSRKFSLYSVKLTITQVTSLFAVCRYVGWAKSPGAYIAKQWAYSRHVYRKLHGNCQNTLFTHEYVVDVSEIKWVQPTSVISDKKKKKKKKTVASHRSKQFSWHSPSCQLFFFRSFQTALMIKYAAAHREITKTFCCCLDDSLQFFSFNMK